MLEFFKHCNRKLDFTLHTRTSDVKIFIPIIQRAGKLKVIKIEFLTPSTTIKVHSSDQTMIKHLKNAYHRQVVQKAIDDTEKELEQKINCLNVIQRM